MTGIFRFVLTILLMFSLATIVSCGDGASSSLGSQDNSGDDDSGDSNGSATSSDFLVNFSDYDSTYLVTKDGTFGETCSISSTSTSNEDIECIFDVLETDAYVREINLTYNIPAEMCSFVTVFPSWHMNYSTGYGPLAISIVYTDSEITDTTATGCLVEEADNTWVSCDASNEVEVKADLSGLDCVYNDTDDGYGPCCFGAYSVTSVNIDTGGGTTVTSYAESDWNEESYRDCIGGGVEGAQWEFYQEDGTPSGLISANDSDGINDSIVFTSNAAQYGQSHNYQVNFYETASTSTDIHSHTGYVDLVTTSTEPYAYNMIDDIDGSDLSFFDNQTRVPWVIRCEDAAGEVIHQIKAYIREWNTLAEFTAYNTSNGAAADYDPHVTGAEGVACDYDPFDGNETCNDRTDYQDIVNGATGGTYDTTIFDNDERRSWFPNFEY